MARRHPVVRRQLRRRVEQIRRSIRAPGSSCRSVTQQANDQDSLLTAFTPLARGVLAVPPPRDAKTGEIGTQSLDAYQAYLLGVRAYNRFDLPEARRQFTRALTLDSTFALAHL